MDPDACKSFVSGNDSFTCMQKDAIFGALLSWEGAIVDLAAVLLLF